MTLSWIRGLALSAGLAASWASSLCWAEGKPTAADAFRGLSAAQAKAMESEFEALTGFSGRARIFLARVERVEVQGPGGDRVSARRLAGLPRGPQAWADGPGRVAGRSALTAVVAGSGESSVCAVIQAPDNLAGSPEQRLRQRLSAALGSDAWKWLVAHEMGHCAHAFLMERGEAPKSRLPNVSSEAFADIFALEWARRTGWSNAAALAPALIKAREASGAERATAPLARSYWKEASIAAPQGSICQTALRHSEPGWGKTPRGC